MDPEILLQKTGVFIKGTARLLVKILLGILVVPLGIFFEETWKWWQNRKGVLKWILGIIYVPTGAFLYVVGGWWNDL